MKLLREVHLAYATSHRQRLQARLDENSAYLQEINQRLDGLEGKIRHLLSPEENEDEENLVGDEDDDEESDRVSVDEEEISDRLSDASDEEG